MSQENGSAAPATGQQDISSQEDTSNQQMEGAEGQPTEADVDSDPTLSKVEKAEIKKTLKKLKIKFNGREIEEDLPFEIPDDEASVDYMRKQLQMSRLAQSKSKESSDLQREVLEFVELLRRDPRAALSSPEIGIDVKEFVKNYIEEEIANSQKSPDQLEREKLQAELKQLRDQQKREKESNQKNEMERLKHQERERYDMLMTQAIEKSDLPKSPYVVSRMAELMLTALNHGIEITPDELLPVIREEFSKDLKEMFAVMPEDVIESLVGKDVFNRVRKKNLAKGKTPPAPPLNRSVRDVGASKGGDKKGAPEKVTMKKFFGF